MRLLPHCRKATVLMLLLQLLGCGGDPTDDVTLTSSTGKSPLQKPVFAFVINVSGRFWDIARAGVKTAALEEGADYDFQVPGQSTAAQQKQIVEALISKGIQGMAISPLSPQSLGTLIDQASEHFPVICQDSDAPESKRLCYIGTDNIGAGRSAALEMAKALPEGGEIAVFVGKLDVGNARDRYAGVLEGIKGTTLKLVSDEPFTDQADRPTAKANVTRVLAKYPDLKGVIGLWGYNAPAAVSALRDSPGCDVKVVGFDEDIETLDAIRNGQMVASVAQQPYEFGYQSIKMLARIHRGEKVEIPQNQLIYVPHKVITQANVDDWERFINEKLASLGE
jgi:ribose transport system substrate-binding protein